MKAQTNHNSLIFTPPQYQITEKGRFLLFIFTSLRAAAVAEQGLLCV